MTQGRDWLLVNEEFVAPQGEGATMGRTAYWVRLGGCGFVCSWCDTPETWVFDERHAARHQAHRQYDPRVELHRVPIFALSHKLAGQRLRRYVITGGEPLLQLEAVSRLISSVNEITYDPCQFEIETAGAIPPGELTMYENVSFNVSPKLATSGNPLEKRLVHVALRELRNCDSIFKFVVDTRRDADQIGFDVEEVNGIVDLFEIPPDRVWLSPCGTTETEVIFGMRQLEPIVIKHGWNLSSRLQILMYGNERGH